MNPKFLRLIWFLLAVAFVIWLASADIAFADDKRHHNRGGDDVTLNNESVLENVISDDSLALGIGLSYGMGDVDINEGKNCMGSEQKANVLFGKQKLALNAWCAALFYELNGKHRRAAAMRCSIPTIVDTYPYHGDTDACIKGEDLSPVPEEKVADIFMEQREQDQTIAVVQMQTYELEERIEALEKKPAPRPRVVQAPPQEKEPELTIEEKEAILATLLYGVKGDEDE